MGKLRLSTRWGRPVCLIGRLDQGDWQSTFPEQSTAPTLDLPWNGEGDSAVLTLLCTSESYPLAVALQDLTLTFEQGK